MRYRVERAAENGDTERAWNVVDAKAKFLHQAIIAARCSREHADRIAHALNVVNEAAIIDDEPRDAIIPYLDGVAGDA